MIEKQYKSIETKMLNFCPLDCKQRNLSYENIYANDEIVLHTEYCNNIGICENAAKAYEAFQKEQKENKIKE